MIQIYFCVIATFSSLRKIIRKQSSNLYASQNATTQAFERLSLLTIVKPLKLVDCIHINLTVFLSKWVTDRTINQKISSNQHAIRTLYFLKLKVQSVAVFDFEEEDDLPLASIAANITFDIVHILVMVLKFQLVSSMAMWKHINRKPIISYLPLKAQDFLSL